MRTFRRFALVLCFGFVALYAHAQTAAITGQVADSQSKVIRNAEVRIVSLTQGSTRTLHTNDDGIYNAPFLDPGSYRIYVQAPSFSTAASDPVVLTVGQTLVFNVQLKVGNTSEQVTVNGNDQQINTTDASVSTIVDRQFVADIPLNGRSFQDLISMTPGVLTQSPQTSASLGTNGDFSINGQRTESNYYIVDGVSADVNPGASSGGGNGASGVMAATSALGTTQSLLSVDDLEEFRVESSSYSAEYGRSPGGQITFLTRSGTNTYHGSVYDYLRNGWFDANDWFADELNEAKQELHQNDFGGTLGGPIWIPRLYKGTDKTFFFVSYEGLRLSQPVAASVQYVPDSYMREQAPTALQPLLDAFPLPSPTGVDYGTAQSPSLAQFFQGYSVPGTIDSTSIRVDHTFSPSLSAFIRYAYTPSSLDSRSTSILTTAVENTQTYTLGTTAVLSPSATNQLRLGYTRSHSGGTNEFDSFGGATPTDFAKAMGSTNGITGQNVETEFVVYIPGVGIADLEASPGSDQQYQWNLTDSFDIAHGTQRWKFGVDFRRVSTLRMEPPSGVLAEYLSAQNVLTNDANAAEAWITLPVTPIYNQVALFAQNDWRINSRLALSGGLRWELAPPPHNATNPQPYTVSGNVGDPSTLSLAPAGTPMWHTSWFSFAPRLGLAWQADTSKDWATVLRAGGGVFFDTNNEIALQGFSGLGTSAEDFFSSTPLPLTAAQDNVSIAITQPYNNVYVYPSHLQLPYTNEWNASIEQGLGHNNIATLSYVGSAGRRLNAKEELSLSKLNPSFGTVIYLRGVTSDYDALQAKFQRNVTKGVNALASYTWSHSIDYGSNFAALPLTRGNSDFDVRNNFQGGLTWEPPQVQLSKLASSVVNGWSIDGRLLARSAYPVTLQGNFTTDPTTGSEYYTNVNLVPNEPIYLYGSQYPGGRSLNRSAFADPTGSNPGTAPRNFARGFGESQVNFAVRREFPISERTRLQFRAEAFNVLNHPNFGFVDPTLTDATFGQATKMLDQSLGTVAAQYQQGGPRSMQFSLRLSF